MRALVLDRELRFEPSWPDPEPGPGEAIVRVTRAGICGTDLALVHGYKGQFWGVPGHEFVGVVERADGPTSLIGRRVVGEINVACGVCRACRRGHRAHCEKRQVIGIVGRDGAFAERLAVPIDNLHTVPDDVPDDAAVFVEPLAAAARVAEQVHVGAGDRAVVVGDGRLGLLVAQVLAAEGAHVTSLGRHAAKLAVLERRGIATTSDPDEVTPGADLVVEATGSRDGLDVALRLVRARGTVVVKSTCAGNAPRNIDWNRLVVDEITLVGSRCGPFSTAIRLLQQGAVDVASLIAARFPLEEGAAAFAEAARPGVMKVLLVP